MDYIEELHRIWNNSEWEGPNYPLVLSNDDVYIVIEDKSNIFRLMDRYGNILAISGNRCKVQENRYICDGRVIPLYVNLNNKDIYVMDNILPYVYGTESTLD